MMSTPLPMSVAEIRETVKQASIDGKVDVILSALKDCDSATIDEVLQRHNYANSVLHFAISFGRLSVVKLLKNKFNMNVNSVAKFYNSGIMSPLIDSIKYGHDHVTEYLLDTPVDINIGSGVETPLGVACNRGNLKMVRRLLRSGADVNDMLHRNSSALLIACTKGPSEISTEVIRCLLQNRADCNHQDLNGESALHQAVLYDNTKAVELLLEHGAQLLKDHDGKMPHLMAADQPTEEIFEAFLKCDRLTREDKANALELRATWLTKRDINSVFNTLHDAMELRHSDPSNIVWKPPQDTSPGYSNVLESRTLEELRAREGNHYVILMECLVIRERILGKANSFASRTTFDIWKRIFDAGHYLAALSVVKHAATSSLKRFSLMMFMYLMVQHWKNFLNPNRYYHWAMPRVVDNCIRNAMTDKRYKFLLRRLRNRQLPRLRNWQPWIINGPLQPKQPSFSELVECLDNSIQVLQDELNGIHKQYELESTHGKFYLVEVCMRLFQFCLQLDPSHKEKQRLLELGQAFKEMFPFTELNSSNPIHLVLQMTRYYKLDVQSVPPMSLLGFFHECRADPNQKNKRGETSLHIVLKTPNYPKAKETITTLFEIGAHPGFMSVQSHIPSIVRRKGMEKLFRPFYPLPLQHLTAYVIITCNIKYEPWLPRNVVHFIESISREDFVPYRDFWDLQ